MVALPCCRCRVLQVRVQAGDGRSCLQIVKLVDFGMILDLSKEPHSRGMMGSPGFVAPEVILGQHHTSQMDNYSLGVLLFVMLVGAKPMTQDQARSMQYALMTPESLRGMHVRLLPPGRRQVPVLLVEHVFLMWHTTIICSAALPPVRLGARRIYNGTVLGCLNLPCC
jgi:serine/threonine protein kinase